MTGLNETKKRIHVYIKRHNSGFEIIGESVMTNFTSDDDQGVNQGRGRGQPDQADNAIAGRGSGVNGLDILWIGYGLSR